MKKAIIFTRVSSDRQHLEEQESRTSALAASEGYPPEQQILISYKESALRLSEEGREVQIHRYGPEFPLNPDNR